MWNCPHILILPGSLDSTFKIRNNNKEKVHNFVASFLWWKLVSKYIFLDSTQNSTLRKIPKVYLISLCGNVVETFNFPTTKLEEIMLFYSVNSTGVCYHRSFMLSVYWNKKNELKLFETFTWRKATGVKVQTVGKMKDIFLSYT